MIKDRNQKKLALNYIVKKLWFPQLEVEILPFVALSSKDKAVTDVDLLASVPDEITGFSLFLVDCKTRKKESPITRILWQRGLMDYIGAEKGMCILSKGTLEKDHRYVASQLRITLLSEQEFQMFAAATGDRVLQVDIHLSDIDLWDMFFQIGDSYPKLKGAIGFSRRDYWMCENESEACRKTLATALRISPNADPAKDLHLCIVADLVALFMLAVTKIAKKIFASYLIPSSRDELAEALLRLLYGGRDSYNHINQLHKKLKSFVSDDEDPEDLRPPDWDKFVELVRQCLDATVEVANTPLLVREIAWSYLSKDKNLDFATYLAQLNPQAAKMGVLGTEYLCGACKMAPEFSERISTNLLSIQQPLP